MEANGAPEKIYIPRLTRDGKLIHEWNDVPFKKFRFFFVKDIAENIEYTRTDAFIEKACEWLSKHAIKYYLDGSRFLGTDELVEDFKIAMTL